MKDGGISVEYVETLIGVGDEKQGLVDPKEQLLHRVTSHHSLARGKL